MASLLSLDPSRTTGIRHQYMLDFSKRVDSIRLAMDTLIVDEDAFGLRPIILNTRWEWLNNAQKAKAFKQWLEDQIRQRLITSEEVSQLWTKRYIDAAYSQGRVRGTTQAARARREQYQSFIQETQDVLRKREELVARSFEDLKGFTSRMSSDATKTVLDSLAKGDSPEKLARKLSDKLGIEKNRARTIARTEIVHAQAEGQLDAYENFGIDEVEALVEWTTAGDSKVCSQCRPLEGIVLTIREARGLIPRHPNCRCAWEPVGASGGLRTGKQIRSAVRKSMKVGSESDWARGKSFKTKGGR